MMRTIDVVLLIARLCFFSAIGFITNYFLDSGSPGWVAVGGAAFGTVSAFLLAKAKLKFSGFVHFCILLFILEELLFYIFDSVIPLSTSQIFFTAQIDQHVVIFLLNFYGAGWLTWFFCRIPGFATCEIIGFLTTVVLALSGHRNFHFESPKIFNSVAWHFGVSPLAVFVATGACTSLFVLLYGFATLYFTPVGKAEPKNIDVGERRTSLTFGFAAVTLILLYSICSFLFGSFHSIQLVRTANGVGNERSPGLSPLGFHSALGSTNQPAAVVRLDGDYKTNPFSPMLYLRENALSEFNGKEMVMAERIYDRDVTGTSPEEHFVNDIDQTPTNRVELSLSAYLLTPHNTAFAIDYPISITPIKNPNPQRFKGAFKAVSVVPQYAIDQLTFDKVGDSKWNDQTWKHYLKTNEDPRYKQTAETIAVGQMTNVQKAVSIIQYLSDNAIYTLTPNHSLPPEGDPVAPFLFGDLRGYCVHFAHATVYMLRSLGIPARIGTGYLTDLSQARDGHILLRMSDRHAWAEVYIENVGWVPFDTKPQHVESHAETQVDMHLLEELMGMIGNDELLFDKDIVKDEVGSRETPSDFSMPRPNVLPFMVGILAILIAGKTWVRWSWRLPTEPETMLKRAYRSSVSYYYDLGLPRLPGETKKEYRERMREELNLPALPLTDAVLTAQYARQPGQLDAAIIRDTLKEEFQKRRDLPFAQKMLAFLNPMSLVTLLRGRW